MSKAIELVILAVFLVPVAEASSACPVMLVSGAGAQDTISVTFRNLGKLPIRRLEFNCRRANAREGKAERSHCYEKAWKMHKEQLTRVKFDLRSWPLVKALISLAV
jgi:hypothetical protein